MTDVEIMGVIMSQKMQNLIKMVATKVKDVHEREDFMQDCVETILKELKKRGKTIDIDKDYPLFVTICNRKINEYFRHKARKNAYPISSIVDPENKQDLDSLRTKQDVKVIAPSYRDSSLLLQMVEVSIDYLKNRHKFYPKETVVLDWCLSNIEVASGMNQKEIAETLGVDKSHVTRAFKRLRNICEAV